MAGILAPEEEVLTREEMMSKFEEIETKWKLEPSPEGFQHILNIFNIASTADLVPKQVDDAYVTDWKAYALLRKKMETYEGDDDDDEDEEFDTSQYTDRFNRFQENIFYARETLLMFMRASNCNGGFPMPSTPEVMFWHSPLDITDLQPSHVYLLYLLGQLFRQRYRRFEGQVFEQIFKEGHATHAWREKCDIKTIIRTFSSKETNFNMWKLMTTGHFDPCVKYLSECHDMEFPDLKIQRRVWSFNDGIYDATDDKFSLYGQHVDDTLVSCKIIERDFAPAYFDGPPIPGSNRLKYEDIDTPRFDSIFGPQNWDSAMLKWMFAFIGRLFYEVNERDSWQVIPFLKGVAGTGKSTVIKVVQLMYNARDVGVISNNIEKKFGLSMVFHKTVFIIPELKGDFQMDQAEFQSMVTGEEISMAVKHENPCVGKWVTPGIIAGNESARWEDKSGSISRRIVVLDFPNKIPDGVSDPHLLSNIKDTELPKIIRKASLAYDWAVENHGNGDIWSALPHRIREEKLKLQFSTNPLYAFVNSDRVDVDAEEYTLESFFISQLKIFASLKFPTTTIVFTEDFYSYIFSDYGITVVSEDRDWPKGSNNVQRQTYVVGCRVAMD